MSAPALTLALSRQRKKKEDELPLPLAGEGWGEGVAAGLHLCAANDLPDGSARGFPAQGIFVVRHGGRVRAWRDACPHYGHTPLAWRRDAYLNADRTLIVCAAHGAQFEPASGLCVLGPCLGQSLTPVPVVETAAGTIQLDFRHPEETQP